MKAAWLSSRLRNAWRDGRRTILRWAPWIATLGLLATCVLVLTIGYGPTVLQAFWLGSVGSWYALTSGTLVRAVPLIFCGLGVAIAFRAGVFNIGGDGQLLVGATAAVLVALHVRFLPPFVVVAAALAAGAVGGAAWAAIAAVMRLQFGILEVISTLMLNFIAADAVSYLVRGPLQEPSHIYPQSATIPVAVRIPPLSGSNRLHWGIVLALFVVFVARWTLARTAVGFKLRVVGANLNAAVVTGRIAVSRVTLSAFLISGALAGLAGATEVLGVTYALYENLTPGYGFTAIAVAILADLQPAGVLFTALLFAAIETGANATQRDAGVPAAWAAVLEASLILAAIGVVALRRRFPVTREAT